MRKYGLIILLFLFSLTVTAQTENAKLTETIKKFHQALVKKDTAFIKEVADDRLMYTHSNGLIERKEEIISNLFNGFLSYSSYKEDSLSLTVNEAFANVKFNADIVAVLQGKEGEYRLSVEEIWLKDADNKWKLVLRNAKKRE